MKSLRLNRNYDIITVVDERLHRLCGKWEIPTFLCVIRGNEKQGHWNYSIDQNNRHFPGFVSIERIAGE